MWFLNLLYSWFLPIDFATWLQQKILREQNWLIAKSIKSNKKNYLLEHVTDDKKKDKKHSTEKYKYITD